MIQTKFLPFSRLVVVLTFLISLTLNIRAEKVEVGALFFEIYSSSHTATLTYESKYYSNYSSLTGAVIVPDSITYDGQSYKVTSIGYRAFRDCSGLTSVTIPNSVTEIGDVAFCRCNGLTSVTIGDSVAFIGNEAFSQCSSLTSVIIPNSVKSIGKYAFDYCSGLTTVTIGDSVTSINEGAFRGCRCLTSVTIPESVTEIGSSAFSGCIGLDELVFNAEKCESCGTIVYSSGWYVQPVLPSTLKKLTIGESVKRIPNYAFSYCEGLTSVVILNSVKEIGQRAFYNCTGLTSVAIGNSVKTIGNSAFFGCPRLSSVTIPSSVTEIGNGAFGQCSGLTSIYYGTDKPIKCYDIFTNNTYQNPTLYMSEEGAVIGRTIEPWKNFNNIRVCDFFGIEEISDYFKAEGAYEIYNLNGVKVGSDIDSLAPGLYIVTVDGHRPQKVEVK